MKWWSDADPPELKGHVLGISVWPAASQRSEASHFWWGDTLTGCDKQLRPWTKARERNKQTKSDTDCIFNGRGRERFSTENNTTKRSLMNKPHLSDGITDEGGELALCRCKVLPANVDADFCFFPEENVITQMLLFHNFCLGKSNEMVIVWRVWGC